MFGMDMELRQAFAQSIAMQSAQVGAIVGLLITKGVITQEEFDRNVAAATAAVDQKMAEIRDGGA
jgi:uncharacterized protein YceH (UPF0502 family)